jgi:hypothetical protein
MANATDYLETNLVNHLFRTSSFTKPAGLFIALFTAAPNDAGGGTEVTGGGYARVSRAPLDANWAATAGGNGVTSNVATLDFGTASANWGTITHFAIMDASTGGNMLVWGALTASRTVNNGDAFQIPASQLTITFA